MIRTVIKSEKKNNALEEIDDKHHSLNCTTSVSVGRVGSYDDLAQLSSKPIKTERTKYSDFNLTGNLVNHPSDQQQFQLNGEMQKLNKVPMLFNKSVLAEQIQKREFYYGSAYYGLAPAKARETIH